MGTYLRGQVDVSYKLDLIFTDGLCCIFAGSVIPKMVDIQLLTTPVPGINLSLVITGNRNHSNVPLNSLKYVLRRHVYAAVEKILYLGGKLLPNSFYSL